MSEPKKPGERPENKEHLDFFTAIVLLVICVLVVVLSMGYWKKVGGVFYASPGFMPTVIAVGLAIMAIVLLRDSLKGSSVSERWSQVAAAFPATMKSHNFWRAVIGLCIFAIYIYGMLGRMPFWLCSLIVLEATLFYLNRPKSLKEIIKIALIGAFSVAGIVLVFQVAFSVPMP